MDYTSPNVRFFADVNKNRAYTTNSRNYINVLGYRQLNTIGNASLLDIRFTKGHYIEPHYHQNATELVYCVTGEVSVSFINPFTNMLHVVPIRPGQAVSVPQGWWHYEEATVDDTHAIAIFDAPIPEVIFGSDILRLTPARAMAETYCLDEAKWKEAIAPITKTVAIGPLDGCKKSAAAMREEAAQAGQRLAAAVPRPASAAPSPASYAPPPGQAPTRGPAPVYAGRPATAPSPQGVAHAYRPYPHPSGFAWGTPNPPPPAASVHPQGYAPIASRDGRNT